MCQDPDYFFINLSFGLIQYRFLSRIRTVYYLEKPTDFRKSKISNIFEKFENFLKNKNFVHFRIFLSYYNSISRLYR